MSWKVGRDKRDGHGYRKGKIGNVIRDQRCSVSVAHRQQSTRFIKPCRGLGGGGFARSAEDLIKSSRFRVCLGGPTGYDSASLGGETAGLLV